MMKLIQSRSFYMFIDLLYSNTKFTLYFLVFQKCNYIHGIEIDCMDCTAHGTVFKIVNIGTRTTRPNKTETSG